MKNLLVIILSLSSILLFSCKSDEGPKKNREADSLALINSTLYKQLASKDSTSKLFIGAFNEIQDNLDSIKLKEKMIVESTRPEDIDNKKEQIKQAIQSIYEFMARNRGAIASLSAKLKRAQLNQSQADSTIAEMQRVIERLTAQVDAKDKELNEMKSQLDKLKVDFDALASNLKVKEEESNQKTAELNTAYYLLGTSKELKEKGVIAKKGGFIGIGKSTTLQNGLRKDMFKQIDITQVLSIPLNCKTAKVLSNHPEISYKIVGDEKAKTAEKIEITNAKEFWSSSKYLVVEVK
jgi:DNA repair exonuclease SbcCD ATPase subunit